MSNGFVKMFRSSLESSVFHDDKTWKLWCYILMSASYKDKHIPFNGKDIFISTGSFVCGIKKLSKSLSMSEQNIRTRLKYLKSTNRITIESNNKFSVIQVQNWDKYQGDESNDNNQINIPVTGQQHSSNIPLTGQQHSTNIPLTTTKKGKKGKKGEESKESKESKESINTSIVQTSSAVMDDINKKESIEMCFDLVWAEYPRKEGRTAALRHFKRTVKKPSDFENFQQALKNYKQKLDAECTEPQFIKTGSTFFNQWVDWVFYEPPTKPKYDMKTSLGRTLSVGEKWLAKVEREKSEVKANANV